MQRSVGTEAIANTWRSSRSLIKIPPEPVPPDYYSVFTQKFYLVSSYTLTARSVQTEIHNLHGKCICCCGYLDKHTRLNFYLYEPQKPNICQGIIVRSGDDSVALWHSKKLVHFGPAGKCLQPHDTQKFCSHFVFLSCVLYDFKKSLDVNVLFFFNELLPFVRMEIEL